MMMCRGRALDPKAEKFFPKLCLLTKPCHCTRRPFCIFTHELETCSEDPICQGDTRTVSVPGPLDPMGITSQSIRGTASGAEQTFITLILRGAKQCSASMLSISGAWAAQECPLLFWGIQPTIRIPIPHWFVALLEWLPAREQPFASNKEVLAVLVVSMRQCLADRHFLTRLGYCPIASNLQRGWTKQITVLASSQPNHNYWQPQ